MATEIERKFLVNGTQWRNGTGTRIQQGYLNRDKARTVRVRVRADQAFLTVKGPNQGASRAEFEYEIPLADAKELLKLSNGPIELQSQDEPFSRPTWLGREVTDDNRYYNSSLASHPYRDWRQQGK
jgi:adenylate cyclase